MKMMTRRQVLKTSAAAGVFAMLPARRLWGDAVDISGRFGRIAFDGDRIAKLVAETKKINVFPSPVKVAYDPADAALPDPIRIGKRLAQYLAGQPVAVRPLERFAGKVRFDGTVEASIFPRTGHRHFHAAVAKYYCKPQDAICLMEWQHSSIDFEQILTKGFEGLRADIAASRIAHAGDRDALDFLEGLDLCAKGIEVWAEHCAAACRKAAAEPSRTEADRAALLRNAAALDHSPRLPARNWDEALQSVYLTFVLVGDSLGRFDQYMLPYYRKGLADGTLTRDQAAEGIAELFCMVDGYTPVGFVHHSKSGESHFVIGGWTRDGREDGYNELSDLVADTMMSLDLIRPEVTLRWTRKTPRAVLRKLLDCERNDRNKRFAFANDEPRIRSMVEVADTPPDVARDYIVCGCNEPAFMGGIAQAGCTSNAVRCVARVFSPALREEVLSAADFDAFYAIFERELYSDLETILKWTDFFNEQRSGDCNILSSLMLSGCIQSAKSVTDGGCDRARCSPHLMGTTNVIDSLVAVKQFVYDEKRCSMAELCAALDADWQGEKPAALRKEIVRDGRFWCNDDDLSNAVARRYDDSLMRWTRGRRNSFGTPIVWGNLTGYNTHFATYGKLTAATPDGRRAGDPLKFGFCQEGGYDRSGATAYLLSIARHATPTGVQCGDSIVNLSVTDDTVRKEENFERFVSMVETYFREGGLHLQVNHVSLDDLLAAQKNPEAYSWLRVRVSGFSAPFVKLDPKIQAEVIARTIHGY